MKTMLLALILVLTATSCGESPVRPPKVGGRGYFYRGKAHEALPLREADTVCVVAERSDSR